MLGSDNTLSYDCLTDNQQYGFNAYSTRGPSNLVLDAQRDQPVTTPTTGRAHQPGCGCTGGGKFWDVNGAVITDNWVHGNHSVGLWADTNNRGFDIRGNYISDNYQLRPDLRDQLQRPDQGQRFRAQRPRRRDRRPRLPDQCHLHFGVGVGQPGARQVRQDRSRSPGTRSLNNWGGVILWENSNRFCNSPANTSTAYCTLVAPVGGDDQARAASSAICARQPYYGDCRWKTQNVEVNHNVFELRSRQHRTGLHAGQRVRVPGHFLRVRDLSVLEPLQGHARSRTTSRSTRTTISAQNTYIGPWRFMVQAQNNDVTWAKWRGKPFPQDAGSTMNAQP